MSLRVPVLPAWLTLTDELAEICDGVVMEDDPATGGLRMVDEETGRFRGVVPLGVLASNADVGKYVLCQLIATRTNQTNTTVEGGE